MSGMNSMSQAQQYQAWGTSIQAGSQAAAGLASLASGLSASKAYDAFARHARKIGEYNAAVAIQTADAERERYRYNARQQLAVLRTQLGSSGVRMAGTPASLLAEQRAVAEYQARLITYGGRVNAMQATIDAENRAFQYGVNADEAMAKGVGGLLAGIGEGAGTVIGNWPREGEPPRMATGMIA
jgi:hypothetical protein